MSTATYMTPDMLEVVNHWQYIEPYAKVPSTKREYRKQCALLERLMYKITEEQDIHAASLLELIARNLKAYEEKHFPLEHATPIGVLKFLMQEHGLTQADLAEIGSHSLVSKILAGERKLTAEQIAQLADRFHLSPAVFY